MRVAVTGATGNVGTAVVRALAAEPAISEIVAIARRPPQRPLERARFVAADVTGAGLAARFEGCDAVVHLAWLIQPGRDEALTERVNVEGSRRVFEAAAAAGVRSLICASSVGAYSPGPKDRPVEESWPTAGIATSFYSRQKAAVERELGRFTSANPRVRVAWLRPGLIFQRSAATEIRRLFAGPFVPGSLLRRELAPFSPVVDRLRVQAVHADDVAQAFRQLLVRDVAGPFNVAAEPPIDSGVLHEMLDARPLRVSPRVLRGLAAAAFRLRLTPVEPGWLDLALGVPLMSTARAHRELEWRPTRSATESLAELIGGMRDGADDDTPPLSRSTSGPLRIRELRTGVGARP